MKNGYISCWFGVAVALVGLGCTSKSKGMVPAERGGKDPVPVVSDMSHGVGSSQAMGARGAGTMPIVILDPLGTTAPQVLDVPVWIPDGPVAPTVGRIDLSQRLPPIGRQVLNDCVAWASAYYLRSYLWAKQSGRPADSPARQFSPTFLYALINDGQDRGAHVSDALAVLQNHGVPTLEVAPVHSQYAEPPIYDHYLAAMAHKITRYWRIDTREKIVAALAREWPVLVHVITDEEFNSGLHPVYDADIRQDSPDARAHGRHAMLVVGVDLRPSACKFKLANSWGPWWGQDGYTWVDCRLFDVIQPDTGATFVQEAFVITEWTDGEPGTPAAAEPVIPEPALPPTDEVAPPSLFPLAQSDMTGAEAEAVTHRWQLRLDDRDPLLSLRSPELDREGCVRYPKRYECDFAEHMVGKRITVNVMNCARKCRAVATQTVAIALSAFAEPAPPRPKTGLRLDNNALLLKDSVTPEGYQNFNWTVFVAASPAELAQIENVTYELHKSFKPKRVTVRKSGSAGFPLSAVGYGEFWIEATLQFKARRKPVKLKRCLQLGWDTEICNEK